MWLIIKSEKKQIDFLKIGLGKRIGKDIKFYTPKIQIKNSKKRKFMQRNQSFREYFFAFIKISKIKIYLIHIKILKD